MSQYPNIPMSQMNEPLLISNQCDERTEWGIAKNERAIAHNELSDVRNELTDGPNELLIPN